MMKETLQEICSLLNKHKIDYLLIGGVAVAYHGYSRSTADLDFWYNPTISNFQKIISTFSEYGIDTSNLENIAFDPEKTYLRFPLSGLKVEFLPVVAENVSFRDAKKREESFWLDDTQVFIIGFDDLIKIKQASHRLRDQADIEELTKRKNAGE